MSNKTVQALLVVVLLCVVYNSWTVATLRGDLKDMNGRQQSLQCPSVDLLSLNAPLLQIQENQASITAGLGYSELMLEGLVRKSGLPLDKAREAFEKRAAGVPKGWQWLAAWEESAVE